MNRVALGHVNHAVRVTRQANGWLCAVLVNGEVNQQATARQRKDVGPVCRQLLRLEDKCGNWSAHADSARRRANEDNDVEIVRV